MILSTPCTCWWRAYTISYSVLCLSECSVLGLHIVCVESTIWSWSQRQQCFCVCVRARHLPFDIACHSRVRVVLCYPNLSLKYQSGLQYILKNAILVTAEIILTFIYITSISYLCGSVHIVYIMCIMYLRLAVTLATSYGQVILQYFLN